ncbi:MAG: yehT 1 [Acidobacteria bacterium]|nr:yehT 1 [Acidobacteriota bacterium]
MIRTIIVDDEPLARSRIRMLLAHHQDIDVVAECSNGREAAAIAAEERPDLLLLDIEMPEAGGFETLAALTPQTPAVIFITAHDDFALDAFEANAVDYLVKPVSQERLDRAMDRARLFLGDRLLPGDHTLGRPPQHIRRRERFAVRQREQVLFVATSSIEWISAEANYARLHTGQQSYLIRESMQHLESQLDPATFVRVHRSAIVNVERMRKLVTAADGSFTIVMHSEALVPLVRREIAGFASGTILAAPATQTSPSAGGCSRAAILLDGLGDDIARNICLSEGHRDHAHASRRVRRWCDCCGRGCQSRLRRPRCRARPADQPGRR